MGEFPAPRNGLLLGGAPRGDGLRIRFREFGLCGNMSCAV
jgi:hypothetical protein